MTFEKTTPDEAYVWMWLPGEVLPVVAGKLTWDSDEKVFLYTYGRSFLQRKDAIPLYEPELTLSESTIPPIAGLQLASCIRDASPDAWGRRVLINRLFGTKGDDSSKITLNELTYLLASGSDRVGGLDFQESASNYIPRGPHNASLEELLESADKVEKGIPLNPELDLALNQGSSIGGARPKAMLEESHKKYIAKFPSSTDTFNYIKSEFIAMRLAQLCGLNVAPVRLVKASKKNVLLIERFDRVLTAGGWSRRMMVSALTLFGLDEMMARYASYEDLAGIIRQRFTQPQETLRELFGRMTFNILCGNNDDHARNHAAFWDGKMLTLTPAYDIAPQPRVGGEATQAMLIHGHDRRSQLATCLKASHNFLLNQDEARAVCDHQISVIKKNWTDICDEAELSTVDRNLLYGRQFLNSYAFS